jgi:poly-gamma-glutamate capsule biosynthesis protein CapA/YwtB (metallophosphatase superfamily)
LNLFELNKNTNEKHPTLKPNISLVFAFLIVIIFGGINDLANSLPHLSGSEVEVDSIENFDDGVIQLQSYSNQDINPNMWTLENNITYNNSPHSLKLYGNTWKLEVISPVDIDSGDVWQVSNYIQQVAEIQGFGITDSINTLLYSFAGTEQVNAEEWITVYQGAFPNNVWNEYQLPVADDWLAKFGYLPQVKGIIFINDRDNTSQGIAYFDEIIDITSSLPITPQVEISFSIGKLYKNSDGLTSVDVEFTSSVYDPDSYEHDYFWDFGDDSTSTEPNPSHMFIVEDDHDYTVLLEVKDETDLHGRASCQITVDPGPTTFPITMNFVGDMMLARRIEELINLSGYEAIFDPTSAILGEAADITVANLECALTDQGTPHPTKSVVFRGSPENVVGLSYAGIDLVTIANNHSIDYGLVGLQQTQSVLDEEEVFYFGAGADFYEAMQPAFYLKSGVNLALFGSSDRTGQYNNWQPYLDAGFNKPGFANLTESNIIQQINSVRNIADLIILEMHSGVEYSVIPTDPLSRLMMNGDLNEDEEYSSDLRAPLDIDIEMRHFAIDHGADAVICHHPHIIQGVEVYHGKLIAHSLGNFVFDLNYPETFPSMILNSKIDETGFYEYSITPVYIDDYIPVRAKGELGLYLLDDLAKRSKDLNTYLNIDRNNVTAEIVLDTTKLNRYHISSSADIDLVGENSVWISQPVLLERNGSISSVDNVAPQGNWQYRLGRQLIWFGNFENEGCTLWEINNTDEFYDTTESFTGSRSFCQNRAAGFGSLYTNLEKRIKLYLNTSSYTLHTHLKTQNAASAGILIQFFDSRTQVYPIGTEDLNVAVNGTTDWTFYHNEFTLPVNTQFINLRLQSNSPQSGVSKSWFDNVGLIEWTDWKDCNSVSNVSYPNDYYWVQFKTNTQVLNANVNYTETNFSNIVNPTNITVQSPNGGEIWIVGQSEDIMWTSQNVNDLSIELSSDIGATWTTIESSVPNTGTYSWTVAALDSSDECLIRIKDIVNTSVKDESDGVFTIDIINITTFQLTVNVTNGWNIVSAPGLNTPDQTIGTWWFYREAGSSVYKFAGSYQSVTTVTPGIGYWMKQAGARVYNTGDEWPAGGIQIVAHNPLTGATGWNLIGGYEMAATASLVTTVPAGQQSGPIYKYSGGYQVATMIDPGYGYWIKLLSAAQIIIPETLAKGEKPEEWFPENWGKIVLTDATGISSTLYAVNGEVDLSQYELPPAPMAGMFDIRYSSGRIAEDINSSMQTIDMSGVAYPLTVRVEGMDMRLMDETGKIVNVNLKSGEDVVINDATIQKLMVTGDVIPAVYALEQNYPNPFNPSTVIEFSLPEDVSNVKLSIYNALGEKVAELVNTSLAAGRYSYQWNAKNVATGLYIYELRTDKFVSVKKMVLMK